MNKIIFTITFSFFTVCALNGCGFKTAKQAEINLVQINMDGDKRITNKIKNTILINFKDENKKKYILDLNVKKIKKVKEKKNNKIVKYELILQINGSIKKLGSTKSRNFSIEKASEFSVNSSHYLTKKSEQDTLKNLIEVNIEEIINRVNLETNRD